MKATPTIRGATTTDLPAINSIIELCVMGWNLPDRVKRLSLDSYRYRPDDLDHLDIFIAETPEGVISGIAALEPASQRDLPAGKHGLLLHGLYVAPEKQRHGIGAALLGKAMEKVAAEKADGLLVKAQADASSYFAAQGFSRLPIEDPEKDYPNRWWKTANPIDER